MSFQAYLDAVETKTGKTPRQIVEQARARGCDAEGVKAGEILAGLKADYDLGRGHGMALVRVIKHGPQIDAKHVGRTGTHRDKSAMLWLDGAATKPRSFRYPVNLMVNVSGQWLPVPCLVG